MSRSLPERSDTGNLNAPPQKLAPHSVNALSSRQAGAWVSRVLLVAVFAAVAYSLAPFDLHGWFAAGLGVVLSLAILAAEVRLRRISPASFFGGVIGGLLGALAALLVAKVLAATGEPESTKAFLA